MQKGLKDLHVVGIGFRVHLRVETGKGLNSRLSDTQRQQAGHQIRIEGVAPADWQGGLGFADEVEQVKEGTWRKILNPRLET